MGREDFLKPRQALLTGWDHVGGKVGETPYLEADSGQVGQPPEWHSGVTSVSTWQSGAALPRVFNVYILPGWCGLSG